MKINLAIKQNKVEEDVEYFPFVVGNHYVESADHPIGKIIGKKFKRIDLKTGKSKDVNAVIDIRCRSGSFSIDGVIINSGSKRNGVFKERDQINFLIFNNEPDTVYIDTNNLFSLYYRTEIDAGFTRLDLLEKDGKKDVMISLSTGYTVLLIADKGKYDKDKLLKDRCVLLNKLENEINYRLSDLLDANPPNENKREWLAILMEFYTYLVNLL